MHLIEPFGFKLDDTQLKRAGMDYWQHVEWHRWKNWTAFAQSLPPAARLWFVESNGPKLYSDAKFSRRRLSRLRPRNRRPAKQLLEQNREHWLRIPMFNPNARSLNLSNCVALVLFEALRQQGFRGELLSPNAATIGWIKSQNTSTSAKRRDKFLPLPGERAG